MLYSDYKRFGKRALSLPCKNQNNMKTIEFEPMFLEELASVKGGYWVKTEKGWEWVETYHLDSEFEDK